MSQRFFQFADPAFLLLLLVLPFLYFLARRTRRPLALGYSSGKLLEGIQHSWRQDLAFIPSILKGIALILFVLALARPQSGSRNTEVLSEGIDIMLTIDTSGSMKALDFHLERSEANRLDVVKKVVSDFIEKRPYDRIGMVIFGDEAFTQCPLTLDGETLKTFLTGLQIGVAGEGTAIGSGLATSVKRMKDQPTKSKVIILLTDGRNNAGEVSPLQAAQIAKEFKIKVYTIGVGGTGPVPYPEETPFGTRKVMARLDIDEDTLRQIAQITGGRYFRATDTRELAEIYSTIDKLEKTEIKTKEYREFEELYFPMALGGFVLMLIELILSRWVFVRIP